MALQDSKYYFFEYDSQDESGDKNNDEPVSETCERIYEESLKCNEYIPYNASAYYEEAEEWAETMNNVTCAFLEEMQQEAEGEGEVVSYTAYQMSFYSSYSAYHQSITGGRYYVAGAALVIVGAAMIAVRKHNAKAIGGDLNAAFVYNGAAA